jgi:hypothetical protein
MDAAAGQILTLVVVGRGGDSRATAAPGHSGWGRTAARPDKATHPTRPEAAAGAAPAR